ncbi:MAG: hypothetical protein R2873_26210 [Caldilineaceae bacterium]
MKIRRFTAADGIGVASWFNLASPGVEQTPGAFVCLVIELRMTVDLCQQGDARSAVTFA